VNARNARLVFVAKAVRTFSYGMLGVFFPVYLTRQGLSAAGLGLAVTLTLLASAAYTYAIRSPARRYGIGPVLRALAGCIALSSLLFLAGGPPVLAVVAAMVGNLAVGVGETGPFLSLEQVGLARWTHRDRLTATMSWYNLTGYAAAAAGAAGVGSLGDDPRAIFLLLLAGGLVQLACYRGLTPDRLAPAADRSRARHASPIIRKLAALFAVDAFGGGFILQSLVVYWFHARFGLELGAIGWIVAATSIMTAVSFLLAAPLAKRYGLVNTMVLSHLVSNGLLIAMAFVPSAAVAVACLLARHLLSQIDVPTRQAFLMMVVRDDERETAASVTNMSRTFAQCVSPSLTGWIMGALSLGAPFAIGGGIKMAYDVLLYGAVKDVPLDAPVSRRGKRSAA
jgi:MFS family permease